MASPTQSQPESHSQPESQSEPPTLTALTASLTPSQKSQLDEVATLMLEIYQTLARMRYIHTSDIDLGPHDLPASILSLYTALHLDPRIIYLYSVLPYLHPRVIRDVDFIGGGECVDFRDKDDVEQGRDPMYADEDIERMRDWQTPLSGIGNHCEALIYDAERHEVGIFGQMSIGNVDRNRSGAGWVGSRWDEGLGREVKIRGLVDGGEEVISEEEYERALAEMERAEREEEGEEGEGEGEDEEEGEEGDEDGEMEDEEDEDEEDEDTEMEDENVWDDMDARPAPDVLKDVIRWYRELKEMPGGGEHGGAEWDHDFIKPLYQKHGWPGEDFDGEAFLVDKTRAYAAQCVREEAEKPFTDLRNAQASLKYAEEKEVADAEERKRRLEAAKTVDEEWTIRWEGYLAKFWLEQQRRKVQEAEKAAPSDETPRPDDLAERELLHLGSCLWSLKRRAAELAPGKELESVERDMTITQKAYAACQEHGRSLWPEMPCWSLKPGETANQLFLEGLIAWRTPSLETCKREADRIRRWVEELPPGTDGARKVAEERLKTVEENIEFHSGVLQNCAAGLEEIKKDGNGDADNGDAES
ncbi:hypothetical protein B0T16DRAFT_408426 [Cercophora newfieldiana]|uniref:Uncharacterized protein n=1 Tax=Cercophora newfieldiana TaxID=92897 RepID=A0AA40CTK9_9PEZI|nr:hypothetical protein B0T16DRAFT_408426 [Cercophora newfieldiana]